MEKGIVKRRLAILFGISLIAALASCAQLHTLVRPVLLDTVKPDASSGIPASLSPADLARSMETGRTKALLLPFADYSSGDSPAKHTRCHAILQAELLKSLESAGIEPVAYGRPVNDQLIRAGVILDATPILRKESPRTSVLLFEAEKGEWSPKMSERIGALIHQNLISTQSLHGKVKSTALDRQTLLDLATLFGADYIIRGRMTVYQSGVKWADLSQPEGVLAFYFTTRRGNTPFMGVSSLEAYEWFGNGPSIPLPASIRSEDNRPFKEHNQKITPIVRVDLFMQDAVTGDVVYTASAETRTRQAYSLSQHTLSEPYKHIDRAISEAVEHVVDPMFQ